MLFKWTELLNPALPGQREPWSAIHPASTTRSSSMITRNSTRICAPPWQAPQGMLWDKSIPSSALSANPSASQSYKPFQSSGEDFPENYLGMIGIPIEMYPQFPQDAKVVLLTKDAAFDPHGVAKIKSQLEAGKNVVITSGLVRNSRTKDSTNCRCPVHLPQGDGEPVCRRFRRPLRYGSK